MLLLFSIQLSRGGDQTSVRVDAEQLIAGARQQTVPHHGVVLWLEEQSTRTLTGYFNLAKFSIALTSFYKNV